MSKPGKVLKGLCKRLGVRLTVKRGKKRVYKSVKVLKRQCAKKKKVKRRRKRRFGSAGKIVMNVANTGRNRTDNPLRRNIFSYMGSMNMNRAIQRFQRARNFIQQKMAIPGDYIKNLQRADLRLANLHHADFHEAKLQGTLLGGSNLFRANLEGAELQGADLFRANLTDARLQQANLGGADLRGANLQGTNLRGARYDGDTQFPEGFHPQPRGMIRVINFGKKRKKRRK